jgi:hypothetical protein
MADDLLGSVGRELETRLGELRPLVAEYERLLAAAAALDGAAREPAAEGRADSAPSRRPRKARRVARATTEDPAPTSPRRRASTPRPRASARRKQRAYAPRGAAQEAIMAALEHGSHTTSELVSVTALPAATIRANLHRLAKQRAIARTTRGGRSAYTLVSRSSAT